MTKKSESSLKSFQLCFKVEHGLLKALIQPAYLACVTFWLALIVAISMVHENGNNKGQPMVLSTHAG